MLNALQWPQNKSLNYIFPTKYVIPKSLKVSHWLTQNKNIASSVFWGHIGEPGIQLYKFTDLVVKNFLGRNQHLKSFEVVS